MMNLWLFFIIGMGLAGFITPAFAQINIEVNATGDPCFMNYTAGVDMWDNCGMDEDWLQAVLLPFQWVTGGIFSIIIVSIIIIMVWIKYETAIYPMAIGIIMVPISYFAFPDQFVIFAVLLMFIGVGAYIWYAYIRQTKEY